MHPAIDAHQLEIAQGVAIEEIRRRNDEPGSIASRYLRRILFTLDHPAGRAGFTSIAQIQGVTRDQLVALHRKYYGPNNLRMAVVGDFQERAMVGRLEEAFAGWAPVDAAAIAREKQQLPRASGKNEPGVFLIHRALPQSTVMLGQFSVDRTNPDRFALLLMNEILGGGSFTSRLMERVRTQEGLAYDVGTETEVAGRDLGTFRAVLQTKTGTVGPAVRAVLEEIQRIRQAPVRQRELALVKDRFINSYIFQFESPLGNVVQLMQLEYDGRPSNYYETLLDKIRAVTRQDILRVARTYLHPDQLTLLVVGDVREGDVQWRPFGHVTALTLENPSTAGNPGEPPARQSARGK
jgi:predicted Zn-dependent peptidase